MSTFCVYPSCPGARIIVIPEIVAPPKERYDWSELWFTVMSSVDGPPLPTRFCTAKKRGIQRRKNARRINVFMVIWRSGIFIPK
jgi:hypothetical protein